MVLSFIGSAINTIGGHAAWAVSTASGHVMWAAGAAQSHVAWAMEDPVARLWAAGLFQIGATLAAAFVAAPIVGITVFDAVLTGLLALGASEIIAVVVALTVAYGAFNFVCVVATHIICTIAVSIAPSDAEVSAHYRKANTQFLMLAE